MGSWKSQEMRSVSKIIVKLWVQEGRESGKNMERAASDELGSSQVMRSVCRALSDMFTL